MARPEPRRERDPVGALTRVLGALAEADAPSLGLRELARQLDAPPSSVQRTLESARASSLVTARAPGRWELGWELYRLAALAQRKRPLQGAEDVLASLREQTGETAVLTVYDPVRLARMFVAAAQSRHNVRFVPDLFRWLPAGAGASALAILAFRPEEERRALYEQDARLGSRTPEQMEAHLADVRRVGVCVSFDEVDLGAAAAAAPIPMGAQVTSSVALVAPRQRFEEIPRETLLERVTQAAAELAQRLGDPGAGLDADERG